jgi:predicted lipoprotein with Yx(FWY)xxD motif
VTVDDISQLSAGEGIDASLLGTVEHPDGIQVTYNGWPLYFFADDSAPGDVNGQGVGGVWYVLDPTGNAIKSD